MLTTLKSMLKRRSVKITLEILAFMLIYLAVRAWMQRDLPSGLAPVLVATTLAGQGVNLADLAKERPVLLHFWATWCGVCKLEQAAIQKISHDHPVVTVAIQSEGEQSVRAYLQEHQLTFPVVVDDGGVLMQRFGVRGVPASFIINRHGEIVAKEVGYTTEWGLRLRLWWAN